MRQGPAVGVDGYARGWVAVSLLGARFDRAWAAPSLTELLADVPAGATVGIDIPIGGVATGWRAADLAARAALGPRPASVFLVPPRPVWTIAGHAAASTRCRDLTGSGLSIQAYGLLARALEAEAYAGHALYEVHPELVFQRMRGAGLPYGKKSWNGQAARRALLAGRGIVLPDDLGPAGRVPPDDVLDATAVAWCAGRIARGEAIAVPEVPQLDARGRPIAIWS